ncbi:MAG: RibD family protein [Bdellovibrionota bacterium]
MYVSINMAMSLDGKIATKKRGAVKFGSEHDSRRMAEIRADHDVVINGAGTFRAYPKPLLVVGDDLIAKRKKAGKPAQPASAFVSSRLDIPKDTAWEKATEIERWVFIGTRAPATRAKMLEVGGAKVIRSRFLRPTPKEILQAFAAAGKERVLIEGGGEFNAGFLEAGLVNRIHLTMAPLLVGGAESPTWFEGQGFEKFPRYQLVDLKNIEGELFLTYDRIEPA